MSDGSNTGKNKNLEVNPNFTNELRQEARGSCVRLRNGKKAKEEKKGAFMGADGKGRYSEGQKVKTLPNIANFVPMKTAES